jgi:hypothetical protein
MRRAGKAATEAYSQVRRKERNAAGADAAAVECQDICETLH